MAEKKVAKKVVKKEIMKEAVVKEDQNFLTQCSLKLRPCAPVVLRIVLGLVFMFAGAQKFGWIGGGSLSNVSGWFGSSLGFPIPAVLATLVAIIEFFGGLALLLGVATRASASLLGLIMIVAIFTAHWNWAEGFLGFWNGVRLVLVLLAGLISVKANGPGKYSLWPHW